MDVRKKEPLSSKLKRGGVAAAKCLLFIVIAAIGNALVYVTVAFMVVWALLVSSILMLKSFWMFWTVFYDRPVVPMREIAKDLYSDMRRMVRDAWYVVNGRG